MAEIKARPDPFRVSERAVRADRRDPRARGPARAQAAHQRLGRRLLRLSVRLRAGPPDDEEGDIAIERDGAKVVIDGMSLMYMLGCEVDYVEDLTGSYFRVSNPNATASCGCGNSFAI